MLQSMILPSKRYEPYEVGDRIHWIGNRFGPFHGTIRVVKIRLIRSPLYGIEWDNEGGDVVFHPHEHVMRDYN